MGADAQRYLRSCLNRSPVMNAKVAQHRADSDLLGEFLAVETVAGPEVEIKQTAKSIDCGFWCETNGLMPVPTSVSAKLLADLPPPM